ncbi:uncharacterized protein LOC132032573 [Lycium ferocissimum]|uniref:uncharacterized protein LOC132032573 n=1 Tax=Lycium ferocissimum TaxID=112874 RepID=UPI0028165F3E|nr:uncharacterized protein LOC132032573 [Lycium ferocissimum]
MANSLRKNPALLDPLYYPVIALLIVLIACVEFSDAITAVDVYRLVQYDISGVPFGSRFAKLNHHAGSGSGSDLSRTVLILPVRELNLTSITEYIEQKKVLGGLLLLLPPKFSPENLDSTFGADKDIDSLRNKLVELEWLLTHSNNPVSAINPPRDDNINAVLAEVQRNDASGQPELLQAGNYKLVVAASDPQRIASANIVNIQWEVTAMEVWLRSFDQRLRESIDYAICLNSVGSLGNQLHLHVSKPSENAYIQKLFQGFSTVAEELGLQVGLKHKKINMSNHRVSTYTA